jgi:hypothetical protein
MEFFYKDRSPEDKQLIQDVCESTLNQQVNLNKPKNSEWGAVFIEGRDREVNDFESFCAIKSFKLYSKFNAPVYVFLHNDQDFFGYTYDLIDKWNIKVIKIPPINFLEEYTKFWINDIFNYLPRTFIHCLTLQPDGMLLKNGIEDYILSHNWNFIGAHFEHMPAIEVLDEDKAWKPFLYPVYGFNGGFSYRNLNFCYFASSKYNNLILKERGRSDNRPPMEDIFYSAINKAHSPSIPTLKEADMFCKDPLTLAIWNDKQSLPIGFHFFKCVPDFPPCNHL